MQVALRLVARGAKFWLFAMVLAWVGFWVFSQDGLALFASGAVFYLWGSISASRLIDSIYEKHRGDGSYPVVSEEFEALVVISDLISWIGVGIILLGVRDKVFEL